MEGLSAGLLLPSQRQFYSLEFIMSTYVVWPRVTNTAKQSSLNSPKAQQQFEHFQSKDQARRHVSLLQQVVERARLCYSLSV